MWTQEQINKARQRAYEAAPDQMGLTDAAVSALMTQGVELVSARGGTMTAERLKAILTPPFTETGIGYLSDHITAQGATVATLQQEKTRLTLQVNNLDESRAALQAKVAAVERVRDDAMTAMADARAERDAAREDVAALRAEVERLKAQVERLTAAGQVLSEHVDKTVGEVQREELIQTLREIGAVVTFSGHLRGRYPNGAGWHTSECSERCSPPEHCDPDCSHVRTVLRRYGEDVGPGGFDCPHIFEDGAPCRLQEGHLTGHARPVSPSTMKAQD